MATLTTPTERTVKDLDGRSDIRVLLDEDDDVRIEQDGDMILFKPAEGPLVAKAILSVLGYNIVDLK